MQNAVCSGAKQQCETVAAMTADHYEIDRFFFRDAMDLGFGSAEDQVAVFGGTPIDVANSARCDLACAWICSCTDDKSIGMSPP